MLAYGKSLIVTAQPFIFSLATAKAAASKISKKQGVGVFHTPTPCFFAYTLSVLSSYV